MSCHDCESCEECQREREEEEEEEEERVIAVPPITDTERALFTKEIDAVFARYPGVRISLPAMQSMILQSIGIQAQDYYRVSHQLHGFILELCKDPASGVTIRKGKSGGLFKWPQPTTASLPIPKPSIDYTCKGCKVVLHNLSQDERSCYRCGEPIMH